MENLIVFIERCCFYLSFKIEEDNVSMCQFVRVTMYNIPLIQTVWDNHFSVFEEKLFSRSHNVCFAGDLSMSVQPSLHP